MYMVPAPDSVNHSFDLVDTDLVVLISHQVDPVFIPAPDSVNYSFDLADTDLVVLISHQVDPVFIHICLTWQLNKCTTILTVSDNSITHTTLRLVLVNGVVD